MYPFATAMEAVTSTATRTGAMAFRVHTNIVPRMPIKWSWGAASPNVAPIISPMRILSTRLILVHCRNGSVSSLGMAIFFSFSSFLPWLLPFLLSLMPCPPLPLPCPQLSRLCHGLFQPRPLPFPGLSWLSPQPFPDPS